MDPNSILLWLVLFSCALVLMRSRSSRSHRGRRVLTTLLVLGTLVGFFLWPEYNGYVAGTAWFLVLVVPGLGSLLVSELMARRKFSAATRIATVISWIYPVDGHRYYPQLIEALGLINSGRGTDARRVLADLANGDHPVSWTSRVLLTRITGNWQAFLDWIQGHPQSKVILQDPMVLEAYLQSLGETGHIETLCDEFEHRIGMGLGHFPPASVNVARLKLAAFSGDLDTVEEVLMSIPETPPDIADYWRATACQAAGRIDQAAPVFASLSGSYDSRICDAALRRLQHPVVREVPAPVRERLSRLLPEVRKSLSHERQFSISGPRSFRRPWVTWGIAAALLLMFAREIPGGTTNTENLIELGALVVPPLPGESNSWRVVTAAFLHYGPLHLLFNLFGLLLFGRRVEKILGHLGMLVTYLTTAIGSVSLIPYFAGNNPAEPFTLVGASGGVMGLIGAILGFQLLGLIVHRNSLINQEFRLLVFIIVMQAFIDLTTPQISTTCHVLGLGIGVLFGLGAALWLYFKSAAAGKHRPVPG